MKWWLQMEFPATNLIETWRRTVLEYAKGTYLFIFPLAMTQKCNFVACLCRNRASSKCEGNYYQPGSDWNALFFCASDPSVNERTCWYCSLYCIFVVLYLIILLLLCKVFCCVYLFTVSKYVSMYHQFNNKIISDRYKIQEQCCCIITTHHNILFYLLA